MRQWQISSLKLGDIFVVLACLALFFLSIKLFWQGGRADKVVVRSAGKIFAELALARDQQLKVPGPLGESVIEVKSAQARIASDPSPRQYCVRQGWLKQAGELAVCLPNQVSIELVGSESRYDSLNY